MQAKTLTYGPPTDEDRLFDVVMFFEYWRLIWPHFVARIPYLKAWTLAYLQRVRQEARESFRDAVHSHKFELKVAGFMGLMVVFTIFVWM